MNNNIILLNGYLREQIWGGTYFKDVLKITNDDKKYGEYWTLSGYEEYPSIIKNGKYQGETLDNIYKKHHELFASSLSDEFPILIKIIATSDDLSVQVHPDDEYAKKENELGKTESWLILDNKKDSKIIYGHNAIDIEEIAEKVRNNDYSFLSYQNAYKGMFIPVESGTIHALGKGLVLIEIQESSNLTYRLYDYDRIDKNGCKRRLDIEKALDVIKAPDKKEIDNKDYLNVPSCTLWDNDLFKIDILNVENDLTIKKDNDKYYLCSVIEGEFSYQNEKINVGDSFIITSLCKNEIIKGRGKIIIVESHR